MKPVLTVATFILLSHVLPQAEHGTAQVQPSTVNLVRLQEPNGTLSRPASYDRGALQFRRVRPGNFGLQNRQDISGRSEALPRAVKVEPEALRKYVGRYVLCEWEPAGATDCEGRLDPEAYFDVTLEREVLWVKPSNREKVRLMPESETKFFVDGVEDARFTFNKNARGEVISLTRWQFVEQVAQRWK